jgi:hypothetical protein
VAQQQATVRAAARQRSGVGGGKQRGQRDPGEGGMDTHAGQSWWCCVSRPTSGQQQHHGATRSVQTWVEDGANGFAPPPPPSPPAPHTQQPPTLTCRTARHKSEAPAMGPTRGPPFCHRSSCRRLAAAPRDTQSGTWDSPTRAPRATLPSRGRCAPPWLLPTRAGCAPTPAGVHVHVRVEG